MYSLLVLAAYRTWGVCGGPPVPTRGWRGAGRWSFNTLWRSYRAALWGHTDFHPLWPLFLDNWLEKTCLELGLANASYAASRA